MLRLKGIPALAVVPLLVVFAACAGETEPASVNQDGSVTLRAEARCTIAESGVYWFETRDVTRPGSWGVVDQLNPTPYNCPGPSASAPLEKVARGFTAGTYEFRVCNDGTSPDSPKLCADANGKVHVPDATDVQYDRFVIPEPPPAGLIPPDAVQTKALEFNSGPVNTSQCPHQVPVLTEGARTFARFQRIPGEPQAAGGYRCEVQSSTYIGKGDYWFEWEARYPDGYEPSCASWCTMRQWHENTSDGGGPVYLAMFMQNGRPQIDGQFVGAGSQTLDVDVREWHTYTAYVRFAADQTGFAELWIDGQYSGRTTTNVTATPSNSYDKEGTYGGDSTTVRTADYNYSRSWRVP